ncbi:MAG: PAS domain-containing protein [Myxococcales bacterium]|nr:PAS domain-containing protein [Myxococcales bacterium]
MRWGYTMSETGDETADLRAQIETLQRRVAELEGSDEERRKAIEAAAMLDNLQVGLVVQGPRSEMLRYNETALDMLGLTAEQILGRDSFDPRWGVIHEDGSPFPGDQHPVVVALNTRKPVQGVIMGVYRPASESRVWLLVSATPLFDAEGRAVRTVCTFTDITAQKQAEVLVREQKELLERMSSPILPIAAGVVLLPLIGQFDAGRAERVQDGILTGVARHAARVVILDITGVSTADAGFAGSLLQISRAVRLLGAEVVVTGMTPAIAQTLVGLGIDLGGLATRGTLQDGVSFALRR